MVAKPGRRLECERMHRKMQRILGLLDHHEHAEIRSRESGASPTFEARVDVHRQRAGIFAG